MWCIEIKLDNNVDVDQVYYLHPVKCSHKNWPACSFIFVIFLLFVDKKNKSDIVRKTIGFLLKTTISWNTLLRLFIKYIVNIYKYLKPNPVFSLNSSGVVNPFFWR